MSRLLSNNGAGCQDGLMYWKGTGEETRVPRALVSDVLEGHGWRKNAPDWWCHQMETPSALLALCEGNPPVTGGFPSQRASNVDRWHFSSKLLKKHLSGWWYETIAIMDWCNLNCYDYSTVRILRTFLKDCIICIVSKPLPAFIWLNTIRCLFLTYFCEILNPFIQNIGKIDVVFIVSLYKLLIKQLSGWWLQTLMTHIWHHCND